MPPTASFTWLPLHPRVGEAVALLSTSLDGSGATSGYTGYVAKKLKMQLENFGCGGATTASILNTVGCAAPYGPPAATEKSGASPEWKVNVAASAEICVFPSEGSAP